MLLREARLRPRLASRVNTSAENPQSRSAPPRMARPARSGDPLPMKRPSASIFGGPIVITGATGQVGVALRRRLAAGRNEIRALTRMGRLRTGVPRRRGCRPSGRDAAPRSAEHVRAGQSGNGRADRRRCRRLGGGASRLPQLRRGRPALRERVPSGKGRGGGAPLSERPRLCRLPLHAHLRAGRRARPDGRGADGTAGTLRLGPRRRQSACCAGLP